MGETPRRDAYEDLGETLGALMGDPHSYPALASLSSFRRKAKQIAKGACMC